MAKKDKINAHKCLVNLRLGSNKDGSPRWHFIKGKDIVGLEPDEVKDFKKLKYIE